MMEHGICRRLSDFRLPRGIVCRPVGRNETRLLDPGTGRMMLVNVEAGTMMPIMPVETPGEEWPLLNLDLDECSIGMSGLAFAAHREDILCLKYGDVFHRQWNDVKLGMRRTRGQRFLKSMLLLSFIILIPYRPFQDSDYFHLKKEVLKLLFERSSWQSPWFQDSLVKLAAESGMPTPQTPGEQEALYSHLASALSFGKKGPQAKMMRWFAVIDALQFQLSDMELTKCVYKFYCSQLKGV